MRKLGPFEVSLGCINLSHAYGVPPLIEAGKALFAKALDIGVDQFDCGLCMDLVAMRSWLVLFLYRIAIR
jgi:hypothetical protein